MLERTVDQQYRISKLAGSAMILGTVIAGAAIFAENRNETLLVGAYSGLAMSFISQYFLKDRNAIYEQEIYKLLDYSEINMATPVMSPEEKDEF